jgi:hypothetical protein
MGLAIAHHAGMAPLVGDAMSELLELTDQERAVARATLCALLAANAGVLADLDDAARDWLRGVITLSASEELPN